MHRNGCAKSGNTHNLVKDKLMRLMSEVGDFVAHERNKGDILYSLILRLDILVILVIMIINGGCYGKKHIGSGS